jgi:glutamate--cysteine ligase
VSRLSAERFASLRDGVFATSFSPQASNTRGIGAEVELLAHDVATNRPVPLGGARGLLANLRRIGERSGWRAYAAYDGTARFEIPDRGIISFEPGGQIEISSVPCADVTSLVAKIDDVVNALRSPLADSGIVLRSLGIDPFNDARDIPLQLDVARYQKMTAYMESVSEFGIRMMRQTSAIQVSLDRGTNPERRWRLLNDLAPYLIAMFASSPIYVGKDTGHRSFRAHCWRKLDPTRTGVAEEARDAATAYTRFALGANDMMRVDNDGRYRAFEYWLATDETRTTTWDSHLTTLFPEVRARGHFEVRSCDAVPLEWRAVPIVVLAALAYDETSAREASVLTAESRALLRVAGEQGLRNRQIARTVRDLFQLALDGATRLGTNYISRELLDVAAAYQARYTARDRSPADDMLDALNAPRPSAAIRSPI